jgi:pimeloyl-ACP methyl ester carboxylesterase
VTVAGVTELQEAGMARPSAFKSAEARAAYCRLYDEAVGLSAVPVEESDIETSFGTTHVLTAGDPTKPPLVALHGMAISSTMWLPVLPALTASHHVRMLDGVGDVSKSVATAVMSSSAGVVEWIDEALDRLGVERAAFVGASFGSWMATEYAMARPDRVERLAVVCPAGIVSAQHAGWILRSVQAIRIRPTPAKLEAFIDSMAMAPSRPRMRTGPWRPIVQQLIVGMANFRRGLREARPVRCNPQRLAASGIPVLALIGRDETLHDGSRMAERFRRQLPDGQVILVNDANHLIFIDQQDIVAEELQKFLCR